MAKYIKQEMVDLQDAGKTKAYYRMQIERNIDTEELVKLMSAHRAGVSEGVIKGVLTQLIEELSYQLAEGYSVTINGLGTFSASVGVRRNKEMDGLEEGNPQLNAQSLEVDGVNYRADKTFVRKVNRNCSLERGGTHRLHQSPYSREERLALAQQYLEKNNLMRVGDYASLTGLSHTKATKELQEFRRDATTGITVSGLGKNIVYVKCKAS